MNEPYIYKLGFRLLGVRRTMTQQTIDARAVTVVSKILTDYAVQLNKNVFTIDNGVDTKIIESLSENTGQIKFNKHSIIYVSNFGSWSGIVETLHTVHALRNKYPDITLTLAGGGTEVPKILDFIKEYHADNYVNILGFVEDRKQLFSLINQSAVGLNISDKNKWRDAAQPIKVLEYSALGIKIVSTDLNEVVNLDLPNVYIFSAQSEKTSFSVMLDKALGDTRSAKDFQETREYVLNHYNWDRSAERLSKILSDASEPANIVRKIQSVIHVTPSYPPALGGLEKVVEVLAHTQAKQGQHASVVTSCQDSNHSTVEADVPITRLRSFAFANTTIMPALFFKLLRIQRHEIVHLHITQAYTPEMVWLAAKFKRFKYVAHVHLDVPPSGRLGTLLELYKSVFLKRVLKAADRVIVPTEDYKQLVVSKYRLSQKQVIVVPNATDHKILRAPKEFPHGLLRLLFVGRLSSQKNIPLLLESLSYYVANYGKNFHLKIVGDGELNELLQNTTTSLGLEKLVSFVRPLSGVALENTYKDSDIFLLSSTRESFGIVLVEAMTKGLPIVCTDILAVRNVIQDKVNGLLVKQLPKDFADAIHSLVSDKSLYERISANNLQDSYEYRWDKVNTQIIAIYEGIA